jgi:predicted O-methyltransferase YrrM
MIKKIRSFFNFKNDQIKFPDKVLGNWHVNFIIHMASILRPACYVELGLYQCELFNRMVPYCGRLYGVDIVESVSSYMKKSSKTSFHCNSTEEFSKYAQSNNLQIDMLFIDADHSYESVKNDFEKFFPLVKDNGIILLHDGYPKDAAHTDDGYCGDGYKAIAELTKSQVGFEMMTIPVHPGVTIVRKRKSHLQWTDNN